MEDSSMIGLSFWIRMIFFREKSLEISIWYYHMLKLTGGTLWSISSSNCFFAMIDVSYSKLQTENSITKEIPHKGKFRLFLRVYKILKLVKSTSSRTSSFGQSWFYDDCSNDAVLPKFSPFINSRTNSRKIRSSPLCGISSFTTQGSYIKKVCLFQIFHRLIGLSGNIDYNRR